ncbi:uncharacterized protein [Dysidea avara]|uniref:uncharacterized protein isoform X2 n=1 Tax=Dysidea avara TaxID=196820 RepID=UPI003317338B
MNFSSCWIVSSDIETDVFGVATDVPGLGIECHEFQVSLLRCIRHSVDGFEQVSSVDCSGIKGGNFQCLLDYVIRYRNKCFWCCDRCSRSQYRHADIQEIITIVGTNMFYFSMQTCLIGKMFSCYTLLLYREPSRL